MRRGGLTAAERTNRRRLIWRLRDGVRAIARRFAPRFAGRSPQQVAHELRRQDYPPGQWHRWYAANRKRQRQLTGLKRACHNIKISPAITGLPRWAVQ